MEEKNIARLVAESFADETGIIPVYVDPTSAMYSGAPLYMEKYRLPLSGRCILISNTPDNGLIIVDESEKMEYMARFNRDISSGKSEDMTPIPAHIREINTHLRSVWESVGKRRKMKINEKEKWLAMSHELNIQIKNESLTLTATVGGKTLQQKWEGNEFVPHADPFASGEVSEFLEFIKFWEDVLENGNKTIYHDDIELVARDGKVVEIHVPVEEGANEDEVYSSFPAETLEYLGFRFQEGSDGRSGPPTKNGGSVSWKIEPYSIKWEIEVIQ